MSKRRDELLCKSRLVRYELTEKLDHLDQRPVGRGRRQHTVESRRQAEITLRVVSRELGQHVDSARDNRRVGVVEALAQARESLQQRLRAPPYELVHAEDCFFAKQRPR